MRTRKITQPVLFMILLSLMLAGCESTAHNVSKKVKAVDDWVKEVLW